MGKRESLPKSGRKDINLSVKLGEDHQHALEIIGNRLAPGQLLDKSKAVRHAIMETARIDPAFHSVLHSVQVFKDPRIEEVLEIVSKLASGLSQTQSAINMLLEKTGAEEKNSSQLRIYLPDEGRPSSVVEEKWRQVLLKKSKELADGIRNREAILNPESIRDLEERLPEIVSFVGFALARGRSGLSFQYFGYRFFNEVKEENAYALLGSFMNYCSDEDAFKRFPHQLGFLVLKCKSDPSFFKIGATYRFYLRDYLGTVDIYEVIQGPNSESGEAAKTLDLVCSFPLLG